MRSVRWSPEAGTLLSASDDKTVRLWDVPTGVCKHVWYDPSDAVLKAVYSADGRTVAAGGKDKAIRIWDARAGASGALLQSYDAHESPVTGLSFHPSGHYLLSSSLDGSVRAWDMREGHLLYTLHGHKSGVRAVSFTQDGGYFASAGGDAAVMLWKTNFEAPVAIDRVALALGAAQDDAAAEEAVEHAVQGLRLGSPGKSRASAVPGSTLDSSILSSAPSVPAPAPELVRSPVRVLGQRAGTRAEVLPGLQVRPATAQGSPSRRAVAFGSTVSHSSSSASTAPTAAVAAAPPPPPAPGTAPPPPSSSHAVQVESAFVYISGQLERLGGLLSSLDSRMSAAERHIQEVARQQQHASAASSTHV